MSAAPSSSRNRSVVASALVVALVVVSGGLAGCAHAYVNAPAYVAPNAGYRVTSVFAKRAPPAVDGKHGLFCLSFSGGGTTAAAMSYAVMEELRDWNVDVDGKTAPLLSVVDCISSVSGGSFTAAYYDLYGDRIFRDFFHDVLARKIRCDLIGAEIAQLPLFCSPEWDFSDVAQRDYDATLFHGKRLRDFRDDAPFTMLNATDLLTGARFSFTQDDFDLIGSDVGDVPIGVAVAASSGFPFLVGPETLVVNAKDARFKRPAWIGLGLDAYYKNRSFYRDASARVPYLANGESAPRYLRLMDGGLADNSGLRAIINSTLEATGLSPLDNRHDYFFVVATNFTKEGMAKAAVDTSAPNWIDAVVASSTVAMNRATYDALQDARVGLDTLVHDGFVNATAVSEVSFDLDPALKEKLPVDLQLDDGVPCEIINATRRMLRADPQFQEIVATLHAREQPRRSICAPFAADQTRGLAPSTASAR